MDLRLLSNESKEKLTKLSMGTIQLAYKELTSELNSLYEKQTQKTKYEDVIYSSLRKKTKIKAYRSFWIGNSNIDIFILNATGTKSEKIFRGLAIEVDGSIHDRQFKMNKDQNKYEALHLLNIALITFENENLNSITSQDLLSNIGKIKRLDFRAKQRILHKIWLITIFYHQKLITQKNLTHCKLVLNTLGNSFIKSNNLFKN